MIPNTKAYERLRDQTQDIINFAVVVCYAVPSLKEQIRVIDKGIVPPPLPKPDYFTDHRQPMSQLKPLASEYRSKLAQYILISNFSFFEAYVRDAIQEIIDFHGGETQFLENAEQRLKSFVVSLTQEMRAHKRKLQEPIKSGKIEKYRKHSNALANSGFHFPSELLASYGIRALIERISENQYKSASIPDLLRYSLCMNIDDSKVKRFHQIRDRRNQIAHGRNTNLSLRESMEINGFLRDFAAEIDHHIVENFFVIEKFAP